MDYGAGEAVRPTTARVDPHYVPDLVARQQLVAARPDRLVDEIGMRMASG